MFSHLPPEAISKCLLCQTVLNTSHPRTILSEFLEWNNSCAGSFCELFNLDSDTFRRTLYNAEYCNPCHKILRDIDFTLKTLACLQKSLEKSRHAVQELLTDNYKRILAAEGGIKQELPDLDSLGGLDLLLPESYSVAVKLIYQSVSASAPFDTNPSDRNHPKSSISLPSEEEGENDNDDDDEYLGDYGKLTRGSARLKRNTNSNHHPSYKYEEEESDPDRDPAEPDDCDSDFMPVGVEAVLSGQDDDSNSESPDDDSSDDDWGAELARRNKKKVPGSKRKSDSRGRSSNRDRKSNPYGVAKKFVCSFDESCTFTTRADVKLRAHINSVHKGDPRPYHCQDEGCIAAGNNWKFGSSTRYYYHIRKVHPVTEPSILCDVCKKTFIAQWELKKHLELAHLDQKFLRCFQCEKLFPKENAEELTEHEELHKSNTEKPFACVLCEETEFNNSKNLAAHVSEVHEELMFKCETCNKAFYSQRQLKRHVMEAKHTKSTSNSGKRSRVSANRKPTNSSGNRTDDNLDVGSSENEASNLDSAADEGLEGRKAKRKKKRRDYESNTGTNKLVCAFEESCSYTNRSDVKMRAHINREHKGDPKPFHCQDKDCRLGQEKDWKFGSTTSYYYHIKKVHQTSEPSIFCDICKKSFVAPWELNKHLKVAHLPNTSLKCSLCKKMFADDKAEELAQHEEQHRTNQESAWPYGCVLCENRDFTNYYDLSIHVSQDHEETLLKCETCNRAFNTKKKLQRHIDSTHKERDPALQCPQCPFIGLCASSLRNHIKWHTTERNFQCDQCPKMYKSQSCLNYHIRSSHRKELPYKCNICGKFFPAGCQLKAHEESHNTVKSYYCDKCGKAFRAKKNLAQHLRLSHNPHKNRKPNPSRSRAHKPRTVVISPCPSSPEPDIDPLDSGGVGQEKSPDYPGENSVSTARNYNMYPMIPGRSVPSTSTSAHMMSNWNHSEQQQFLNTPIPLLHGQHQYPANSNTTLDLSQGSPFLSTLQQHHNTLANNNYFSSMH